jgi:hypothetical protein
MERARKPCCPTTTGCGSARFGDNQGVTNVAFFSDAHAGWHPSVDGVTFDVIGAGEMPTPERLVAADLLIVKGLNAADRALHLGGVVRRAVRDGAVIALVYEARVSDIDRNFLGEFANLQIEQSPTTSNRTGGSHAAAAPRLPRSRGDLWPQRKLCSERRPANGAAHLER